MSEPTPTEIIGTIERVTYYAAESGYSVLRVVQDGDSAPITVIGNLPEVSAGERLRLHGSWVRHPRFGQQFKAHEAARLLPDEPLGIERFIGSGLIKGIGPATARKLVAAFGAQTLDVIEHHPERLAEVPRLPASRIERLLAGWREHRAASEALVFLQRYDLGARLGLRIYRTYGAETLARVRENPYQLIRDVWGVGFKTADRIARALGLPADSPQRLKAGIWYALQQAAEEGHTLLPEDVLIERAAEWLDVPPDSLAEPLAALVAGRDLVRQAGILPVGADAIYLNMFYQIERDTAARIAALQGASSRFNDLRQLRLNSVPDSELSPEQRAAIAMVWQQPITVLTGGPGTGKTTTLNALVAQAAANGITCSLAAPTGRAAKRLAEATGQNAKTLHRLLGYSPNEGFTVNASVPLNAQLVVVDEASMLDLALFHALLTALKPGTHLLLVGDVDQLPSVNIGDILRDLIASKRVAVTRLMQIYRQAQGSQIIQAAHSINRGEVPTWEQGTGDLYFFGRDEPASAAELIVDIASRRVPNTFGYPPEAIQVLSPMHRGPAGVTALNDGLQQALNPNNRRLPEVTLEGRTWRISDRMMQLRNDYQKEVYNGDIGRLARIDREEQTLTVLYDDRMVSYEWSEADALTLAYAISIHKSQGSEFPVVIVPLLTSHYIMLQRKLLYTAITRARKLCILVGSRKALAIAVRNAHVQERYSGLSERLVELLPVVTG
ncbi:MAG: ATP-dependent RecD-like DNA helicase [Chloroflexi bacterium]|nr:ATP-dependent RecD-like DNA helicase [Chloroflexota bacterium]